MTTEESVRKHLASLKSDTATGADNLGAKVLKCSTHVIAAPIARIMNISIATSQFPSRWKCAQVTLRFKGGSATNMNCYRPISVLPLLSKVLERHIFDSVYEYLTCNDLISQRQSGFRKHHSCQTLLIRITDYLLDNMDKDRISGLTMVYLRKAFDLVNHKTFYRN